MRHENLVDTRRPHRCASCGKPCGLIDAAPRCLACTLHGTDETDDHDWLAAEPRYDN